MLLRPLAATACIAATVAAVAAPAAAAPLDDPAPSGPLGAAAVTAPKLAWSAATTAAVPVTWGAANATTYDVTVSVGTVSSAGKVAWSTAQPWLTATTLTTSTYATARQGAQLRFTVTPFDATGAAGTPASAAVEVPLDDKSRTLAYSPGWSVRKTKGSWLGTTTRSSQRGATLVLTTGAKSLQLIGIRCTSCGSLSIIVDGRAGRVISSAGRSAQRATLGTITLGRKTVRHTVVLQATSAKPVSIDAVGLGF